MQFEGEHKVIPLRGIERAMENGVAQDGGMNEVINLIPRNGSYVPYAPTDTPTDHDSLMTDNVNMVRIHHTSTGDNTIVVMTDHYLVNGVRKEGVIHEIVFIGNRMDLSTENGIEHWLWKNGEYINQDDLNIHDNGESVLPYVSFKVERGIYDGRKVYGSARFIRLHKNYTDADTSRSNYDEAEKYVKNAGSMGGDAISLLDSIRYAGGITGYILVAAAWRVKSGDASNPKYIMASPILLMGTPEIYMKDNKFETKAGTYLTMPTYDSFLDIFSFQEIVEQYGHQLDDSLQDYASRELWDMTNSDDRDTEDMGEYSHVNIDMQEDSTTCILRKSNANHDKAELQTPALWSSKFALWKGGNDAEHRGIRITHGSGNVLYFKLSGNIADNYKDEIDRLCVFVSPIISPYKHIDATGIKMDLFTKFTGPNQTPYNYYNFVDESINNNQQNDSHVVCSNFIPVIKSDQEIRDEIKNIAGLYKVAEVQLNEINNDADQYGWIKVNLSEGRLATDRLVQHSDTMLKVSDIQPVGFSDGHIFGYNERLHVFNFQKNEVFRLPYDGLSYYGGGGQYANELFGQAIDYAIEVTDSHGSITVHRFHSTQKMLNPLISCADIDAKQIRLIYKYPVESILGPPIYSIGEVIYQPIEIGGIISGYIQRDIHPSEPPTSRIVTEDEWNNSFNSENIKPDSYSYGKNEIRVSNVGTHIFEVDKSYRIGHGEIIALARLSMGLSQDNYSKFPLVVFCTDGIYTLGVDANGKYAYSSQAPLSRVVCTNPNGICEIDGAVLFPTEYGLQMVTMDGVKPIVTQAIGAPKNLPIVADGLEVYRNAIRHEKIVQLMDDISWEDFLKDIQYEDTYIRYLHAINSVVIYNRYKSYSYLVDLKSWSVTKLEQRIAYDDADFPKQTFRAAYSNEGVLKSVQFDYYSGADNAQCLLVTRPIALESRHLKTAYRVVMRGAFEYDPDDEEERYAGLYAFGSLDGNHWDYLNGVEKLLTSNRFHDLGIEVHHVSYKYMMLVFAGTLSKDSHIDGLEITSRVKYNNKLK